jgi:iron complex outermembrane receptor protein
MKCILYALLLLYSLASAHAQTKIAGKVFDAINKEPLQRATVADSHGHTVVTGPAGAFSIVTADPELVISFSGYHSKIVLAEGYLSIPLLPSNDPLAEVVVSADRTAQKRSEAPIAIASINKQTIEETKPQRLDQLLNKISGVFMVNLGNEQHEMSIRQPMTTKSVFLYMEDGIPLRTTGVYNHNALLEMNLPAAKSIEVIKGPSSALYGAEAIAGAVNLITQAAPAFTSGGISMQGNNNGYRRADVQAGSSFGKWGMNISGYYAARNDGLIDFSDFHKTAFSIRTDYKPGNSTTWTNTLTYVDYYSDMTGALDSLKFSGKNYSTPHTFTFRSVNALRIKSMLGHQWNGTSESSVAFMYRNNAVKQNPSYSVGNTSDPLLYKGQINNNSFNTFAVFVQHTERFKWLAGKLVGGLSMDLSPQSYYAKFIWIQKDAASGKYTSYASPSPDSLLQRFNTGITNLAGFANYEFSPLQGLKIVAAIRYDAFRYNFENLLDSTKTTAALSSVNTYGRITPKIGFTYNHNGVGIYGNYSEGYVPPQLTELYTSGSKVAPYLLPQTFSNYEIGGWLSLARQKIYADWSLYLLLGRNEIISVKQPDNTYTNQNAGKTKHIGIEYGITWKPVNGLSFRISGTNAKHVFVENIVRGVNYNGKEMSSAPRFTGNSEITYKPSFIKGFRFSAEWQHQGKYFMDDLDQFTYGGFDIVNFRTGYAIKHAEIWINLINAFNSYYSTLAIKNATANGNAAYSYQLGDPREITLGIGYRFGK